MSTTTAARTARRRTAALAASVAVAGLLLTGCAASGSSDSAGASGDRGLEAPAPAVGTGGGVVTDSSGEGRGDGGSQPLEVSVARSVIVRADMTVRVDDLDAAYAGMALAAGRHGAVIASQTTSEGDILPVPEPMAVDDQGVATCPSTGCPTSYASSTTTYRVDNDEVDDLIRDLSALGTVEASYRTTEDVSGQVADVDARLETARASLARVRVLMDKAVTIADVVTLEAELSRRQADLESLQAQQRVLADQTAQATVTVRLVDEQAPVVVEEETGFLAGLSAGWDAFTGAAVVALTVIGALVPFLLVLVPLGLLIWWLVRRGRRPTAPAAQPAPPVESF
ncbi:DUF4349 domain-containing protein [Longivirga aurantiaca]|uniref:DUF4349 domain-containing protein n=1 Tax=Longivirga aurantiaca TaxID=1837743 RepID=A0ABW1T1X2_9ACTN